MNMFAHGVSHLIIILAALAACAACSDNAKMAAVLDRADSLLADGHADSSYILIESAGNMVADCPKSQRMRYELLKAKALGKSDVRVFTSDSTVKELVSYYDSHGNRNERMLARYLLGCVYRDLGDAPRAIGCYRDAVEMADTASADCDWLTLSRVYGQMARVLNLSDCPLYGLEQERLAAKAAWKAKDTILALQAYSYMADAYYAMNNEDSVISISKKVYRYFKKFGYDDYAAKSLPTVIYVYLNGGQYDEARKYMAIFEKESGLFDDKGDMSHGKEFYYDVKGRYYQGIGKSDSAFYYFNKLRPFVGNIMYAEAMYRVMMDFYVSRGIADSVSKYARLYCAMNDSSAAIRLSEEVGRMQALYDYDMAQDEMGANAREARGYMSLFIAVCLTIIVLYVLYQYNKIKKRKFIQAFRKVNKKYAGIVSMYGNASKTLSKTRVINERYRKEKEEEIQELKSKLILYRKESDTVQSSGNNSTVDLAAVVLDLHEKAVKGEVASTDNIEMLHLMVEKELPDFMKAINDISLRLTYKERIICILIKYRFFPSEISVLLDIKTQNLSNTRAKINSRLFKTKGAKTLDANIWRLK